MSPRLIVALVLIGYLVFFVQKRRKLERRARRAAAWFYWLAALTGVNATIATLTGSTGINFVFGLATQQVVHAISARFAQQGPPLGETMWVFGVVVSIGIVVAVWAIGQRARRLEWRWYLGGILVYATDGLIYLSFGDYTALAANGAVLAVMVRGFIALVKFRRLKEKEEAEGDQSA